jgi:hypothetical protein
MDVPEAVDRWVSHALARASAEGFAQIDLDDLLEQEPPAAVSVGMECLDRVLSLLPEDSQLDALLTIPLEPAAGWDPAPSLDRLLGQDWTYGPGHSVPGLYLVHALQWRTAETVEEYRRPLDGMGLGPRIVAYYRAWRELGESDFERCIYLRSLPL